MKIDTLIFDLGNVLIDWSPSHLYDKIFSDKEKQDYFLNNICTMDWHSEQDAGRDPEEATAEKVAEHPDWEQPIRAFYARWKEMFGGTVKGSVQILKELKEKGYKLYALTNWNAELFNQTVDDYPFLSWFDGRLVSGEVKLKKPDPAIYKELLRRYSINPHTSLFIDDTQKNVEAAEALGIRSILFKSPAQLRDHLNKLNIL